MSKECYRNQILVWPKNLNNPLVFSATSGVTECKTLYLEFLEQLKLLILFSPCTFIGWQLMTWLLTNIGKKYFFLCDDRCHFLTLRWQWELTLIVINNKILYRKNPI